MRRRLIAAIGVLVVAAAVYLFVLRDTTVAPRVTLPQPTATIGLGSGAVAVGPDGTILPWLPSPEEGTLPQLPLATPPESGRLAGPMLQQARVLGGAPADLRPYLAGSFYGESGVGVELRSGIELRFGDASQVAAKWRAAAAVLADPTITALDSVNLHAPRRPSIEGSTYALPQLP